MSKKESPGLSLVMSGFHPALPIVVIRPKNMADQRLMLNYTGTTEDNKLSSAEIGKTLSTLTRRYGTIETFLTTQELLELVRNRSPFAKAVSELKFKVSYTEFVPLMTSGKKRYFVIPTKEMCDPLSFGHRSFFPVNGGWIDTSPPGGVAQPTRPAKKHEVLKAMGLDSFVQLLEEKETITAEGTTIERKLILPHAVQTTVDTYLKEQDS